MPEKYAPIALFVYARPDHTRRTVEALLANAEAKDTQLVIFSDAERSEKDAFAVQAVRKYIKKIQGFASITINEANVNKGLADSIVDGVTSTVNTFGKVIVVEDDLVTSPYFLRYMNDALNTFADTPEVMHVAAHMLDIDPEGLPDTFFLRQSSCWGWGTWKRAWQHFSRDSEHFISIFTPAMQHAFNLDGAYDYWSQLTANHNGTLKTWAVFWYASVFANNGLCLHPKQSLVHNIGFDGSGENCGESAVANTRLFQRAVSVHTMQPMVLTEHSIAATRYQRLLCQKSENSRTINTFQQLFLREGNLFALLKKKLKKICFHRQQPNPVESFVKLGCKPWTHGYHEYKWKAIGKALEVENFSSLVGVARYGYRIDERIVEYPWFFSRLPKESGTLLDAGSVLNHAQLLDHPKLLGKKLFISTLSHESAAYTERNISYIYEDLRSPCYKENFFDWICCLSTLEHIGMDNTLLYTSDDDKKEFKHDDYIKTIHALYACLKPGGRLFLSVPYGAYKDHKWFQVFNANMLDAVINAFNPTQYNEEIFQYAEDCWRVSDREQAKNATCFDIHVQKEYDEDFAAFSRSVACLELIK